MTDLSPSCDVAIVGAGAAGLATAIFARRAAPTLNVVVLDGAVKPGAKILVSGGSRCNITNAVVTERDFWGGRLAIIRKVLRAFPVADTMAFFREIGVTLHEEAGGKLFPDTNRARDVLDALAGRSSDPPAQVTALMVLGAVPIVCMKPVAMNDAELRDVLVRSAAGTLDVRGA